MDVLHQKCITKTNQIPVHIFNTDVLEYPPHWHERIEIVYVLGEELKIGLNNVVHTLKHRDIFIVGMGEIHYFLMQPQRCDRIIVLFELSLFEELANYIYGKRIVSPHIQYNSDITDTTMSVHSFFEEKILTAQKEVQAKEKGYEFIIKARLYDIAAGIVRYIPSEKLCPIEKNKHLKKLELLEDVTNYIDKNFRNEISLSEISRHTNFSMYYFTRFFKDITGMTFWQYLNNYKVSKAVNMLINTSDSISEIAFNSGFNSITTFNRVFRQIKGCSPSDFKRATYE